MKITNNTWGLMQKDVIKEQGGENVDLIILVNKNIKVHQDEFLVNKIKLKVIPGMRR